MKFIHTADMHLGRRFTNSDEESRELRFQTFDKILNLAKDLKVDYIFLVGDIVEENQFRRSDIYWLLDLFESISPIQVLFLLGNHDFRWGRYISNHFSWPKNIYIFDQNTIDYYDDDEKRIRFIGSSWQESSYNNFLKLNDQIFKSGYHHFLLHHGEVGTNKYYSIDLTSSWVDRFDYIALGHIHRPNRYAHNIIMPGTPEPLEYQDQGKLGVIYGEFDTSLKIKRIPVAEKKVIHQEVFLDNLGNFNNFIKSLNQNNYYQFIWNGCIEDHSLIHALENSLDRSNIKYNSVNKTTRIKDLNLLYRNNKNNLVGKFIEYMNSKDLTLDINQRILELGLEALIGEEH